MPLGGYRDAVEAATWAYILKMLQNHHHWCQRHW